MSGSREHQSQDQHGATTPGTNVISSDHAASKAETSGQAPGVAIDQSTGNTTQSEPEQPLRTLNPQAEPVRPPARPSMRGHPIGRSLYASSTTEGPTVKVEEDTNPLTPASVYTTNLPSQHALQNSMLNSATPAELYMRTREGQRYLDTASANPTLERRTNIRIPGEHVGILPDPTLRGHHDYQDQRANIISRDVEKEMGARDYEAGRDRQREQNPAAGSVNRRGLSEGPVQRTRQRFEALQEFDAQVELRAAEARAVAARGSANSPRLIVRSGSEAREFIGMGPMGYDLSSGGTNTGSAEVTPSDDDRTSRNDNEADHRPATDDAATVVEHNNPDPRPSGIRGGCGDPADVVYESVETEKFKQDLNEILETFSGPPKDVTTCLLPQLRARSCFSTAIRWRFRTELSKH